MLPLTFLVKPFCLSPHIYPERIHEPITDHYQILQTHETFCVYRLGVGIDGVYYPPL